MRKVLVIAIGLILIVLIALAIKTYGAEKIYISEKLEVGGSGCIPDSVYYIVYGDFGVVPIDIERNTSLTDSVLTDSVSGDYASYENLQLRIFVYAEDVNCNPCEEWQWVRQTQTFYDIGPASGDSTCYVYAIARNPVAAEQAGAYLVARYVGGQIEDTCNNTFMVPYMIRSEASGSDGVVKLELIQSSCLRGDLKCKIMLHYGNFRTEVYYDTIPGDVDSLRLSNY